MKSLQAVHRYLQAAWASGGFGWASTGFGWASVGFGLGCLPLDLAVAWVPAGFGGH